MSCDRGRGEAGYGANVNAYEAKQTMAVCLATAATLNQIDANTLCSHSLHNIIQSAAACHSYIRWRALKSPPRRARRHAWHLRYGFFATASAHPVDAIIPEIRCPRGYMDKYACRKTHTKGTAMETMCSQSSHRQGLK